MNLLPLALISSCWYSFTYAEDSGSKEFKHLKCHLVSNCHALSNILISRSQCSAFFENDEELIELMLKKADYFSLEYVLFNICKNNDNFFKTAIQVALKQGDLPAIKLFFSNLAYIESSTSKKRRRYLFGKCAVYKNYDCVNIYGESLCKVTDNEGKNILHIAAEENDETLFETAQFCELLINERDHSGKLPMEYVKSREMAQKFNEKWLKVAKKQFLSLESSSIGREMCSRFKLESEEAPRMAGRIVLKDAFEAGIDNVEDVYCPYLKMKVNLLEGKGHDFSGMILEWLTYLIKDIFSPADSETDDLMHFKSALFTKSEATDEYVPTGKFPHEVYEFVGKVIAIARYFGLGLNNKLMADESNEFYKSIQKGDAKMKFLRLEVHEIAKTRVLVLKGRNVFVKIYIDDKYSYILSPLKESECINYFKKAFDNLTDAEKMKFLSLFLNESDVRNGIIHVRLKNAIIEGKNDFRIHKGQKKILIKRFTRFHEYKEVLQRIIQ